MLLKKCIICDGEGWLYDDNINEDIECPDCDDGIVAPNDDEIVFVNVYKVTRHFGGHEEGGWWYNWYECIESIPVKNKHSKLMKEEAKKLNGNIAFGNIYSVLGGVELDVLVEEKPCQRQTKERPYYS